MSKVECLESGCGETVYEQNLISHLHSSHDYSFNEAHELVSDDESTAFLSSPDVAEFEDELLLRMYETMKTIREMEKQIIQLSDQGEMPGTPHPCIGQEAVATGACLALQDDDVVTSTHRGHGHAIANGLDPRSVFAEIGGKESGVNGGRGGTMHMIDPTQGFLGQNAIVGAGASHAAGAALRLQMADDGDQIGAAFIGEGAMNQGIVPETMNIASIWNLPLLFICENNQYEVTFSWTEAIANESLPERAKGCGVSGKTINGQDVLSVYKEVTNAAEHVRNSEEPYFIECQTYRYSGHFAGEETILGDVAYRSPGELEYWRTKRDPITALASKLESADILSETEREHIDQEIREEIEEAEEFMENSEYPDDAEVMNDVYDNAEFDSFPLSTYR